MTYIGIDPAFRKDGFWTCCIEGKLTTFTKAENVLEFDRLMQSNFYPEDAFVVVENSNEQNFTFDMFGSTAEVARKSRNVGTNQAVSQLTVQSCIDRYGIENVISISPKQKGQKYTEPQFKSIINQDKFSIVGYTGNQDQRDAFKLALIARQQHKIR